MAMITVCDVCRQEIKDDDTERYVFPELVINDYAPYISPKKQWRSTCCMDLCEDCQMKVIHALKGVVNLERKLKGEEG